MPGLCVAIFVEDREDAATLHDAANVTHKLIKSLIFSSERNKKLTRIFLFFEYNSMRVMVVKNLSAHRKRNQMTALIYSLALGFLIFLSISSRM